MKKPFFQNMPSATVGPIVSHNDFPMESKSTPLASAAPRAKDSDLKQWLDADSREWSSEDASLVLCDALHASVYHSYGAEMRYDLGDTERIYVAGMAFNRLKELGLK